MSKDSAEQLRTHTMPIIVSRDMTASAVHVRLHHGGGASWKWRETYAG